MKKKGRSPLTLFLFLVAFSLAGSSLSRLTHLDPGPIAPVTSLLTLGAGVTATFGEYAGAVRHPWRRLLAALVLGAGAEIVGLATGYPFGHYIYSRAWWPTIELPVGPFPLPLPFAWLLMAGASTLAAEHLLEPWTGPWWRPAFMGGLIAAIVDLAMEPVMAGPLGYWHWTSPGPLPGGAPIANFLGWWAVGTLAGLMLTFRTTPVRSSVPLWVLGGFGILILGLGMIG